MIDQELLQDFIEARKEQKKPMTERATKMLVRKLERLEREGHCPDKLMERAIIQGWQDVYPDNTTLRQTESFVAMHSDRDWAEGLELRKSPIEQRLELVNNTGS